MRRLVMNAKINAISAGVRSAYCSVRFVLSGGRAAFGTRGAQRVLVEICGDGSVAGKLLRHAIYSAGSRTFVRIFTWSCKSYQVDANLDQARTALLAPGDKTEYGNSSHHLS